MAKSKRKPSKNLFTRDDIDRIQSAVSARRAKQSGQKPPRPSVRQATRRGQRGFLVNGIFVTSRKDAEEIRGHLKARRHDRVSQVLRRAN